MKTVLYQAEKLIALRYGAGLQIKPFHSMLRSIALERIRIHNITMDIKRVLLQLVGLTTKLDWVMFPIRRYVKHIKI